MLAINVELGTAPGKDFSMEAIVSAGAGVALLDE